MADVLRRRSYTSKYISWSTTLEVFMNTLRRGDQYVQMNLGVFVTIFHPICMTSKKTVYHPTEHHIQGFKLPTPAVVLYFVAHIMIDKINFISLA